MGDTYTYADFVADGGDFADLTVGGMWTVEIKVPYSWITAGYTFPSASQRTVHFNWETGASSKAGTTNPKKVFWPVYDTPLQFNDPGVGVSRP